MEKMDNVMEGNKIEKGENYSGLTEWELGNDDVIRILCQKFRWICMMQFYVLNLLHLTTELITSRII